MTDRATVQTVVRLLGLVALLCVGGLIFLADRHNLTDGVSTALVGLAGAAAGGVAGLLAKTDSIDVAGLDELKAQNDESFLPALQHSLDKAHEDGRAEAASQYVPATLEAFEPVGDPVPAAASADLASQLDAAVAGSAAAVDVEPDDDAALDDPFEDDAPARPIDE